MRAKRISGGSEALFLAPRLHEPDETPGDEIFAVRAATAGIDGSRGDRPGLVLAAEGEGACVELARRHAIYAVLDPDLAPRTAEEKLVYVADRRGGQRIEPLEARAEDTARRNPSYAAEIARAIPLAKALERDVFADISFGPDELAEKAR